MSRIEYDLMDFDLFQKDIDSIDNKIDSLKSLISNNFKKEKNKDLYVDGFKNIIKYLEDEKERLAANKKAIKEYHDTMNGIEEDSKKEFDSIKVPSFEYKEPSLRPVVYYEPGSAVSGPTVVAPSGGGGSTGPSVSVSSPGVPEPVSLENPLGEDENKNEPEEVKTEEETTDNTTELEDITNNNNNTTVDLDDNDNQTVVTPTTPTTTEDTTTKKEEKKSDNNNLATIGAIAGAVGLVGVAAGAGVAIAKKKKDDEDDDDRKNNRNNNGMYGYRY